MLRKRKSKKSQVRTTQFRNVFSVLLAVIIILAWLWRDPCRGGNLEKPWLAGMKAKILSQSVAVSVETSEEEHRKSEPVKRKKVKKKRTVVKKRIKKKQKKKDFIVKKPEPIKTDILILYRVKSGDTLESIAEKSFKDRRRWKDLLKLNRGRLPGDGRIKPGQELLIPAY